VLFLSAFRAKLGGLGDSCFTVGTDFKHDWFTQTYAANVAVVGGGCDLGTAVWATHVLCVSWNRHHDEG
jgi:hypothetical protein